MRVVVVGVCASGKTTLVKHLREHGVDAHNVAQEHSGIRRLWSKKNPDLVIMLDAALPTLQKRRSFAWGEERLIAQRERLQDAKIHANLYLPTDNLNRDEVLQTVMDFIRRQEHEQHYA